MPSFSLVLGDQMSKFTTREMMEKFTKQACYLHHESALFGDCDANFLARKFYTTICLEGILFKSYFGQEWYKVIKLTAKAIANSYIISYNYVILTENLSSYLH